MAVGTAANIKGRIMIRLSTFLLSTVLSVTACGGGNDDDDQAGNDQVVTPLLSIDQRVSGGWVATFENDCIESFQFNTDGSYEGNDLNEIQRGTYTAVSYTHLTLPTIYSV